MQLVKFSGKAALCVIKLITYLLFSGCSPTLPQQLNLFLVASDMRVKEKWKFTTRIYPVPSPSLDGRC